MDQAYWEQRNPSGLELWIPETFLRPLILIQSHPIPYLRDARVGGVQETAEKGVAVVRADGRGRKGEKVMIEQTFSKELVKEARGVAQGTSEPWVLDGNIHNFSGCCCLVSLGPILSLFFYFGHPLKECLRRSAVEGIKRRLCKDPKVERSCQRVELFYVATTCLYIQIEPEKRAYIWILLEWHEIMVGMVVSAEWH